jgi:hypothetical protein
MDGTGSDGLAPRGEARTRAGVVPCSVHTVEETVLVIGADDGDHLRLEPRAAEPAPDPTDAWIPSLVEVSAGAFRARAEAGVLASELARFRDALAALAGDPRGRAALETEDGWLAVRLFGDGFGHFDARCELRDPDAVLHRLEFTIGLNARDLPEIRRALEAILDRPAG